MYHFNSSITEFVNGGLTILAICRDQSGSYPSHQEFGHHCSPEDPSQLGVARGFADSE
jgi:hypothetical protein